MFIEAVTELEVEELYYVSCQCCSSRAELWGGGVWTLATVETVQVSAVPVRVCAPPPQGRYQTDTVMMIWGFPKKFT